MLRLEPSGPGQGFLAQTVASTEVGGWAWSLEKTMGLPTLGAAGPFPSLCWDKARKDAGGAPPQGKDGRIGGGKLLLLRYLHLSYCEVRG